MNAFSQYLPKFRAGCRWLSDSLGLWIVVFCLLSIPCNAFAQHTVQRVGGDYTQPVCVTQPPGDNDNLFIVERRDAGGIGRVIRRHLPSGQNSVFLNIDGQLIQDGGLLYLAFHPDFQSNGLLYVTMMEGSENRLEEYQANPSDLSQPPAHTRTLLIYDNITTLHTINWVGFRPGTDQLFLTTGDGGPQANDPSYDPDRIHSVTTPFGKILRFDLTASFDPPATSPEHPGVFVVAIGLRNPFRACFDPAGGMFLGDVGFTAVEEIDYLPATHFLDPANDPIDFGWVDREGTIATITSNPDISGQRGPFDVDPIFDYLHNGLDEQAIGFPHASVIHGNSITGGYVFQGRYFFADFINQQVYSGIFDSTVNPTAYDGTQLTDIENHTSAFEASAAAEIENITSFGTDNAGNLYIVDFGNGFNPPENSGEIFRVVCQTQCAVPIVNLEMQNLLSDGSSWFNHGSLGGSFVSLGTPTRMVDSGVTYQGQVVASVWLDGSGDEQDGFVGPAIANSMVPVEDSDRTIEMWVLNPTVETEEGVVSWGDRGTEGENWSVNYGSDPEYGAVRVFGAADTGWGALGPPAANQWHHLVMVYRASPQLIEIYVDGVLHHSEMDIGTVNTVESGTLNVGVQNADGVPEVGTAPFTGHVNTIRVYDQAISAEDISIGFLAGPSRLIDDPVPGVVVDQFGGTEVSEDGQVDSYTIRLLTVPAGTVEILATTDEQTEISLDQANYVSSLTLLMDDANPRSIFVRAIDDTEMEGPHFGTITHQVSATNDPDNYPLDTSIENVAVSIIDNDVAPIVLIDLSIENLSMDGSVWTNTGTIGGIFQAINTPTAVVDSGVEYQGESVAAVMFDGTGVDQDGYQGPLAMGSGIPLGDTSRSVEAWILNPSISIAEGVISWGDRGTIGENWVPSYGTSSDWGALGVWGPADTGWGPAGPPPANQWHHIVWAYTASPQKLELFVDGSPYYSESNIGTVNTIDVGTINVGIQNNDGGFAFGVAPLTGFLNSVRVYDDAMSPNEVSERFELGPSRLGFTETVTADQWTAFRGFYLSGELADTFQSDDAYLKYNPGITLNPTEAPVWLIFDASLSLDVPQSLMFSVEASANTVGLNQTIEAYNWTTQQYVEIDSADTSFNSDVQRLVDLTLGSADYVQPGTGAVRIRIGWRQSGIIFVFPWTICIDHVFWTADF